MQILIEALEKIAKIPCQCNCGPVHFADCPQAIALKALKAAQHSVQADDGNCSCFEDWAIDIYGDCSNCGLPRRR